MLMMQEVMVSSDAQCNTQESSLFVFSVTGSGEGLCCVDQLKSQIISRVLLHCTY